MTREHAQLPFAARVNVPDTVRGAEVDITISANASESVLEQADHALMCFVTAADAGMFAGETLSPSESLCRVEHRERRDFELRSRWSLRGVDRGAFRVLLNVWSEMARRGERLADVAISSSAPARDLYDAHKIMTQKYPGRTQSTPFELTLGDFFFENREPLIRMAFRRRVTDQDFERIGSMVSAWDYLLRFAGFLAPSEREDDLLPEPGELFMSEPQVIEHLIYGYQGPAESFNPIINMAVKLHLSGLHLAEMAIE